MRPVKKKMPVLSLVLLVVLLCLSPARAAVVADAGFSPPDFAKATPPERALLLPDGKYFLLFDPDTLTDQTTGALTRYLPDGTLDTSFAFTREYKHVNAITPRGNGQYYIAVTRYAYGTKDIEQVLRINGDGSIDSTFAAATVGGPDLFNDVWQIIVQPDGKVLVAGLFHTFGGDDARDGVVRLLADGTLDSSFAPVTINGEVYSLALQNDGKIVISGVFTTVNNVSNVGVVRLNSNGSLDSGFQATGFVRNSTGARIRGITVLSDGQILLSGAFRTGTGSSAKRYAVIRVSSTGAFDSTFDSSTVVPTVNTGRDLEVQPDGKIIIAINNSVYRLNTNGTRDTSFHQPATMDARFVPPTVPATPVTVDLYPNGQVLVGGIFTDVDPSGAPNFGHFGVVRLNSDGNVDSSLPTVHRTGNEIAPSSFARLTDGATLIAFAEKVDSAIPYNVGRLLDTGALDPSFTLSSSDPNRFLGAFSGRGVELLPDGNLFLYGIDTNTLGPIYGKVQPNGAEDTSFATNHGVAFQKAVVAPNGKIVVAAGNDPQITLFNSLGRLSANGAVETFEAPASVRSNQIIRDGVTNSLMSIYAGNYVLAVQADGKVLFEYLSQDAKFHLVRLNTDGTLDGTFAQTILSPTDLVQSFPVLFDPQTSSTTQPPDGAWTATPVAKTAYLQADGRIVITGPFVTFGNVTAHGIVRLMGDGTVDSSFNAGNGPQWTTTVATATFFPTIENIQPLSDGTFLLTGTFEAFNGTSAPGIAHLNANGSVDSSFVAPVHRDKRARTQSAFRSQPDGSFLLSGPYLVGNETDPRSLIRLVTGQGGGAVNISTRLGVGTGDDVLIEGFIVQGPAGSSKKMMVRAIGPSLSQFGVADALANPLLEIHDSNGATVAMNNDWKTTQIGGLITSDQFAEISATGVAPSNDAESALIVALQPGSYTAVVRGVTNTTGTGVVDAFDLDAGSSARLANIATRGLVRPGDQLMIAGFIVQNGAVKVVVRAIGPSLTQFGISNALPDTTLQLRDQQGTIVLENDDWKTSQQQELESIGLQPSHDKEAALVTTIQPGQYTAQVRGKGNDSGIAVVQVYFLQ
jgi:uncharacterized delta-60 repeat protein